ncbi:hypothetical protein CYMTET_9736 [Cymbomonas tetramitiformis]|uniref:Uncharacterized protein n=1 Tax=Cymbomonas tetramitiformis TaxID=36881 RepID=A0AAE0LF65_9CHLO|nr:hypothetical protein CYMTET_9736 [Cymbomonas tetramitiformis]
MNTKCTAPPVTLEHATHKDDVLGACIPSSLHTWVDGKQVGPLRLGCETPRLLLDKLHGKFARTLAAPAVCSGPAASAACADLAAIAARACKDLTTPAAREDLDAPAAREQLDAPEARMKKKNALADMDMLSARMDEHTLEPQDTEAS